MRMKPLSNVKGILWIRMFGNVSQILMNLNFLKACASSTTARLFTHSEVF